MQYAVERETLNPNCLLPTAQKPLLSSRGPKAALEIEYPK